MQVQDTAIVITLVFGYRWITGVSKAVFKTEEISVRFGLLTRCLSLLYDTLRSLS